MSAELAEIIDLASSDSEAAEDDDEICYVGVKWFKDPTTEQRPKASYIQARQDIQNALKENQWKDVPLQPIDTSHNTTRAFLASNPTNLPSTRECLISPKERSPKEGLASPKERSTSPKERSPKEGLASSEERSVSPRERSTSPKERPPKEGLASSEERSVSPRERSTSPKEPSSKEGLTSPKKRSVSPKERSTSPKEPSPKEGLASSEERSVSPRERSTSPKEPSSKEGLTSPKERSVSPRERSTSPKEPSSKEGLTSPKERSVSPKERSTSPKEPSPREGLTSPRERSTSPKEPSPKERSTSTKERLTFPREPNEDLNKSHVEETVEQQKFNAVDNPAEDSGAKGKRVKVKRVKNKSAKSTDEFGEVYTQRTTIRLIVCAICYQIAKSEEHLNEHLYDFHKIKTCFTPRQIVNCPFDDNPKRDIDRYEQQVGPIAQKMLHINHENDADDDDEWEDLSEDDDDDDYVPRFTHISFATEPTKGEDAYSKGLKKYKKGLRSTCSTSNSEPVKKLTTPSMAAILKINGPGSQPPCQCLPFNSF